MKAWTLPAPAPVEARPLELVEAPIPEPAPDELLVRVRACAVCRTDLHVVEGELPVRRPRVVPGHQAVGEVVRAGPEARGFRTGQRVGIAWLRRTCGGCRRCRGGRENLCDAAELTGWTADGGFAELAVVPAAFAHAVPEGFPAAQAAPLLCAGIIGYRALRLTGLAERGGFAGARLGIYGFGAAGHVVLQLARARGAEVHVLTRDRERHQALAAELGAAWVGGANDLPPAPLDAAILFAPAGELVPAALKALDKGATLVLGGIHMSPTPPLEYALLYGERVVRSVANNTREDARELLEEAARIPVRTHVVPFPFEDLPEALIALKRGAVRGAAVVELGSWPVVQDRVSPDLEPGRRSEVQQETPFGPE
ncbi:MAG: zinc-dependent alcohol dehydrogenase family protein [Planctomycetes bacterium]|nr:zinc-dependent alcohol dehydrogenase family protein [Planctomycetota bacterium]